MNKKHLLGIALACATVSAGAAYAQGNADNGKELFNKSQCMKCHGAEIYTRPERKVKDLESLGRQVRMCDSQLSVNWFDDEINDVVAYLNREYYKFEAN